MNPFSENMTLEEWFPLKSMKPPLSSISYAIAKKCNDENINEIALGRDGRLSGEK